jgi:hypothetical protein
VFKTEDSLVRQFVRELRRDNCPWGSVKVSREFNYQRGRVDVLALADDGNHLIAFEAKLTKWREALQQAYRNTSFVNSSYVLMPMNVALRVQTHADEFHDRNVGLCYIRNDRIVIVLTARKLEALEPFLQNAAVGAVTSQAHARRRSRTDCAENLQETQFAVPPARRRRRLQANLSGGRRKRHSPRTYEEDGSPTGSSTL